MINTKLLQIIQKWAQEIDIWLRTKTFSEVKVYISPSDRYGEPALCEVRLESVAANRIIEFVVAELEQNNKLCIAGDIREINGAGIGYFFMLPEKLPNCKFTNEDFSFQLSNDEQKNITEFQRISENFKNFLQTDLLPIIEGKFFINTYYDYRDL